MPSFAYYALGLLCLWIIVTIGIIDGRGWYRHWNLWLNVSAFLISSFFFSLIMVSPALRQLYIMLGGAIGAVLTYVLLRYMNMSNVFEAKSHVLVISFTHLITFWQASALLYFMIVLFDAKLLPGAMLFALLTFLLGRGSILDHGLKKSSGSLVLGVLVLTTTECSLLLSLLPVHYYILATVLTIWFFFVVEMVIAGQEVSSRKALFKRYALLSLSAMAVLLATTAWQ
jgi:hypothetical protein